MEGDMKWSEVPVGEVFSRRAAPKMRWVHVNSIDEDSIRATINLLNREGDPCVPPNVCPIDEYDDEMDDCFLTGERLVVEKGVLNKFDPETNSLEKAIVLRIEKAEPDLKVPVQFEYDGSVFNSLWEKEVETRCEEEEDEDPDREPAWFSHDQAIEIAKAMFDAGIAHAAKAVNPEIKSIFDSGYAAGKKDAFAETEDMFEQGVEHGRAEAAAESLVHRVEASPEQVQAAKEWAEAEEKRRNVLARFITILASSKEMKPKKVLKELRRYIRKIY